MGTRKEKLLQKVDPNLLKMVPKLSGTMGSFIDFDSGENSVDDGPKKLMMRFMKNLDISERLKKNQVKGVEVEVSRVKYNDKNELCGVESEKLTFPFKGDGADFDSDIPGRKLQKLKMTLEDEIYAKWRVDYNKRCKESEKFRKVSKNKKKGFEEDVVISHDETSSNGNCEGEVEDDKTQEEAEASGVDEEGAEEENDDDTEAAAADDENEDADDENEDADDENEEVDKKIEEDGGGESIEHNDPVEADVRKSINDAGGEVEVNSGNKQDTKECDVGQNFTINTNHNEDDLDGCSLVPAYQPGGGLLYGGSELTQYEEDLPQNLLSPSLKFSVSQFQSQSLGSKCSDEVNLKNIGNCAEEMNQSFNVKSNLFQDSQNANDSFDINDAFQFCSGVFPEENCKSQENHSIQHSGCYKDSLTEKTSSLNENGDRDFEKLHKKRKNIIELEESDVEDDFERDDPHEDDPAVQKILSDDEASEDKDKPKKNRKSLHFSDEEDEPDDKDDDNDDGNEEDNDDEEEEEDEERKSVNYDSEENEVINPKEFFDKEAELSGSEEWSGDEDERGLDVFDQEDGDADEIDNDQVRSQLEKIHIRRVLDEDNRQVRLIQEILFEDGDLHSDGKRRDRKFRWKNLGAFDEDGEKREENEPGNSSDDDCEDEEELKMRYQKQMFLMEKKNNEDCSSDDENVEEKSLKVSAVKSSVKVSVISHKLDNIKTGIENGEVKLPFLLSSTRGSFLKRDEEFLSRLAKTTSALTDNVMGPKNSKNFVFAPKSPEKSSPENKTVCKRQVDEAEIRHGKKIKLIANEIDTGPSILDLFV